MMKAWGDLIGGGVLLAVGLYAMIVGTKLGLGQISDPQPGFFPFWSGAVIALLSALVVIEALRGKCSDAEALGTIGKPAFMIASLAAYVAVLNLLGYLLATAVLAVLLLWVLGARKWWALALAALLIAGGSYTLFDRLLNVTLPAGILAGWF